MNAGGRVLGMLHVVRGRRRLRFAAVRSTSAVNRIITNLAAFYIATTSIGPDNTGKATVEDIQASTETSFTVHLDISTSSFELTSEGVPA
ncbi:hypothetical protein [Arthrobacter wenxiniae]|uniref:Uncharacterized protein n=1 Tax=Arthrobacter wenxiniae TaxID=2713570 RepID=A0A7Y7IK30_9MICC|nr:hypothetical protein [Arthrobacter wenxiniae]NVM96917.1 hypothetical protein [Arthrobacter wenxiniae]